MQKHQKSNLKFDDQWIQKIDESNYYSLKMCMHYEDTLPHPLTHWTLDMVWWQHNNNDYLV